MGHEEFIPYENGHNSVGSYDGGSCLGSHGYRYKENDSCSYRWQAAHRATTTDRAIYGNDANKVGYSSPNPERAKVLHLADLLAAGLGEVLVSKSGKSYQRVAGKPFVTAFSPWSNEAHHLIPNAELKRAILRVAENVPEVISYIVQGLLEHKYNNNHWKNMLILPTDVRVGGRLGLPTHKGSHPIYSAMVFKEVRRALAPYNSIVDALKAKETKHPSIEHPNVVEALVTISAKLHRGILALGVEVRARRDNKEEIGINYFSEHIKGKLNL